jgi:general secretion pathway protein E
MENRVPYPDLQKEVRSEPPAIPAFGHELPLVEKGGSLDSTAESDRATATQSATTPALHPLTPAERVIAHLQTSGRLNQNDLNRAKRLAEEGTDSLIRMLVRLGLVSERDMAEAMAEVFQMEVVEPDRFPAEPVGQETLSLRF